MNSVLDASALLAYLHREPGHERVTDAISHECAMSAANWAEVLTKLVDEGVDADAASQQLARQGILGQALVIRELDEEQAREIAKLRPTTRSLGLSLGARACLALACVTGLPALTTDRAWRTLQIGVEIQIIR